MTLRFDSENLHCARVNGYYGKLLITFVDVEVQWYEFNCSGCGAGKPEYFV